MTGARPSLCVTEMQLTLRQDMAPLARLARLEAKYESEGLRRTVEGVLLIHEHGHPHVLLLQFGPNSFRLYAPTGAACGRPDAWRREAVRWCPD